MPPLPIAGQATIHPSNEVNNIPPPEYSEQQKNYINFRRRRIISARDMRDMNRPEWDDMPFLRYYEMLKRADDQYVAPRKNESDTSINLGTIRDKDTSLVEYAMSHTFEPVAQVFDDSDEMMDELAETSEDMLRKSFILEGQIEDKAKLTYRSMVAFGTALVEDLWVERWIQQKTLKNGFKAGMGSSKAEWEQKLVKQYDGCQSLLWDLRKCYFGDIRKFFMNGPQGQPYFFTVTYESYDVCKQLYGNWDRWVNVPQTVVMATPEIANAQVFSPFWTLRPVSLNYVEIIKYYDPIANEFSLTLNGVDMLPIMEAETMVNGEKKTLVSGFPLTEVSPSGAIPFAKYDLEPMHEFAYSKSQPGKMRVSADVQNMMIKLFIQIFKQKAKPTMGNIGGKNFGPEIFEAGNVINDVRENELFPVLPVQAMGLVPADFSFYELMNKEQDKQSIERTWQGMNTPSQVDETATQDLNNQKAQSLKVAALFDGIISGNTQLYWLRMYNIMRNWTKPVDKQIDVVRGQIVHTYRTVTMPTEIDGGQSATKKIIFTKSTPKLPKGKKRISLDDSMKIHQDELDSQKETGNEVRLVYLHPEILSTMKLNWFFRSVPVPNANDPLTYMVFAKQIQDATMFFGPQSLNVKKLKHRFARLTGNDFDTWFLSEQDLQLQQIQNPGIPPPVPGAPMTPGATPPPAAPMAQPSIASAVKGKMPTLGPVMK